MQYFKKRPLYSIATISVVIFSIATAFTSVLAWYSSISKNENEADNFDISNTTEVLILNNEWTIYGYNVDDDTPTISDSFELGEYDTFIPARNLYNRRIIHLRLFYPNGTIENSCLKIDGKTVSNSTYLDKEGSIKDNISNVIQFKFLYENIEVTDAQQYEYQNPTAQEVFDTKWDAFDELETITTFFDDIEKGEKHMVDSYSEFVDTTSVPLPVSSSNSLITDLYIEYNYNKQLAIAFNNNHNEDRGLDAFTGENKINFTPDIQYIGFDLGMYGEA